MFKTRRNLGPVASGFPTRSFPLQVQRRSADSDHEFRKTFVSVMRNRVKFRRIHNAPLGRGSLNVFRQWKGGIGGQVCLCVDFWGGVKGTPSQWHSIQDSPAVSKACLSLGARRRCEWCSFGWRAPASHAWPTMENKLSKPDAKTLWRCKLAFPLSMVPSHLRLWGFS